MNIKITYSTQNKGDVIRYCYLKYRNEDSQAILYLSLIAMWPVIGRDYSHSQCHGGPRLMVVYLRRLL